MLRACLEDLAQAIGRIHADRHVDARIEVADTAAVRCDPQDLDELLGNLLDNAWRMAGSAVHVTARDAGRHVCVTIADDGPGMSEQDMEEAMVEGRRLDEREGGHGYGLAISRELAELHGGSLALARSALGGLEVRVRLPKVLAP